MFNCKKYTARNLAKHANRHLRARRAGNWGRRCCTSPATISCVAGIPACEKGGQWEHALLHIINYIAGISSCDRGGQLQQAVLLFDGLRRADVTPDVISYSAGIPACDKGGYG